jgi:uncharacterized protein YjlB
MWLYRRGDSDTFLLRPFPNLPQLCLDVYRHIFKKPGSICVPEILHRNDFINIFTQTEQKFLVEPS